MNKIQSEQKISAFAAAIIGATVGATAVYFSNQKNRKQLQKLVNEMLEAGEGKVKQAQEKAEQLKVKGKQKIIAQLEKTKEQLENSGANVN